MTEKGVRLAEIMATRVARYEKSGAMNAEYQPKLATTVNCATSTSMRPRTSGARLPPDERDAMGAVWFLRQCSKSDLIQKS